MWEDFADGEDVTVSGGRISLGGGVGFHFSPAWALEGAVQWTGGKFTQVKVGSATEDLGGDAFSATSARVNIGVSFTPK